MTSAVEGAARLRSGERYQVLSVHPPWAWSIIFAGKNVENRSWTTRHRGPLLIHASSRKYVGEHLDEARREIAEKSGLSVREIPNTFPCSQILGVVDLLDCIEGSPSPWAYPEEQHWILANAHRLEVPVPIKGRLRLWEWTVAQETTVIVDEKDNGTYFDRGIAGDAHRRCAAAPSAHRSLRAVFRSIFFALRSPRRAPAIWRFSGNR